MEIPRCFPSPSSQILHVGWSHGLYRTGGLNRLSEQQHFFGNGGFTGIRVRNDGKSAAFGHLLQIRRQRHSQIFLSKRGV